MSAVDRGKLKFTGPILVVVGLLFAWNGYQKGNVSARLKKEGVAVPGSVVKHETSFGRRRSRSYTLIAEYAVKDGGQLLQQSFPVSRSAYNAHPDGTPVTVRYLASAPNVAEIEGVGDNSGAQVGIGAVMAVVGAGLALYAFR